MRGPVLAPGDAGYDQARVVWNAMIDRRPAVIARCAGVSDIRQATRFARSANLPIAIRGGAHNIAGSAVCDDGLMLDLSGMRSVRIDPDKRRAYVEPGATLGDFDREAQTFALATPLGINSTTGVAGLTLGGGFGWLTRKHGMTVDNLLSAHVVDARGEWLRASASENSDLFWAIRGGGGNFGVVTMFEFQLHPVGPEVFAGLIVFPFEQARTVLERYRAFVESMAEDMNVWVVLRQAPPLPFLPASVHGKEIVALAAFHAGDTTQAARAVEPLRSFGQAHGEHLGPVPYTAWQQAFDPLLTPGARNYWKSHNFSTLSDGAIASILEYAGRVPSPQCEIFLGFIAGRASTIAADATAYAHRDAKFVMNVHSRWERPEDDGKCITWARDFFNAAAPHASGGVYVNFLTADESDRVTAAYGPNYQRLVEIKTKYDPDNVFCVNQNIRPGG
jgi:FAD/FMN-containing dehydrogenase